MAKKNSKKQQINPYDKKHLANLAARAKVVQSLFDKATKNAIRIGASTGFHDATKPFYFKDYPQAKKRIDELISQLQKDITKTITDGDREEWLLSCEKNDIIVDAMIGKKKVPKEKLAIWKHRNLDALESFQSRRIGGISLSRKVWNLTEQFKGELEMALDIGLGEGMSAAELSRDVRRYLNEPNKLFRRVRDKHGNLRLSQNAKNYNPGRGVYRSSFKNAIRLTGTENNIAYRTSDHERWEQLDFVIGIEIRLSNNHTLNGVPFYDICDELAGSYPKDFKFTGWHPKCRCFATPILASEADFTKYNQKLIAGEDLSNHKFTGEAKDVPTEFKKWAKDNVEHIKTAKSKPYFVTDNEKYFGKQSK